MDSLNNNQIITEKWPLDKIEKDKKDIFNFDDQLEVIEPFVQAVKDGIISIDEMHKGIKAAQTAIEYYNEHMIDLHGCQKTPKKYDDRIFNMERILMESKITSLQLNNDYLQEKLKNLQTENDDLQKTLKKYENRLFDLENISGYFGDKITEAEDEIKLKLSQKTLILKIELEKQFLYIKKYFFLYALCGFTIAASGGLILVSLLQIFHR